MEKEAGGIHSGVAVVDDKKDNSIGILVIHLTSKLSNVF
jgi:hypothetical protein